MLSKLLFLWWIILTASIYLAQSYTKPTGPHCFTEIIPFCKNDKDLAYPYITSKLVSHHPNLPNSLEYVTNSRGQKVHVRTYWPTGAPVKSIVFFLHGYSGHSNGPPISYIAKEFNAQQIACVMLDFHGHGYSDGERGLVTDYRDLIDDTAAVIEAVYSPSPSHDRHLRIPSIAQQYPFFVCGFSMGGATAMAVSYMLTDPTNTQFAKFRHHFRGTILAAPMIEVEISQLSRWSLKSPMAQMLDKLPFEISTYVNTSDIWSNRRYVEYIETDPLTYWNVPWIKSIQSAFEFTDAIHELIPKISYPFIVFHDPDDTITKITGSYRLMEDAASSNKQMVLLLGGKHDVIANRAHSFVHRAIQWIRDL